MSKRKTPSAENSLREARERFEKEFKEACRFVESMARSVGHDCEIVFHEQGVQVAPLSWGGDVQGRTLHEALRLAINKSRGED